MLELLDSHPKLWNLGVSTFIQLRTVTSRILNECSCYIEYIKGVEEKRPNAKLVGILSPFRSEFNKFKNTGA